MTHTHTVKEPSVTERYQLTTLAGVSADNHTTGLRSLAQNTEEKLPNVGQGGNFTLAAVSILSSSSA